jgi:predicted  nucleic acid-binding Zn-ribbon protein
MTPQTRTSLKELQNLDRAIVAIRSSAQSFDLLLEEVNAPVGRLEQEVEALEKRLTELKLEENRIELTIEERRVRAAKLQERMDAVRNVREEAAVHAELEMVRRALESEEQEALSLLDQIKRLKERSEEQEAAYQEALAEVEPRREELVEKQQAADGKLKALQAERDAFAAGIDPGERQIYDSIMAGARDVAVAELTQDGACGNCYNMVPLQIQNQIRHGDGMIRCEGCGVILTPESEEGLARAREEGERIDRALKASTDQRDEERAALSEAEALEEAEQAATAEATTAEATAAEASGPISDDPAPDVMSDSVFDTLAAEELVFEDVASDDAPADESAVENGDDVPAEEPADDEAGEVADADIVAEGAEPREPPTDAEGGQVAPVSH